MIEILLPRFLEKQQQKNNPIVLSIEGARSRMQHIYAAMDPQPFVAQESLHELRLSGAMAAREKENEDMSGAYLTPTEVHYTKFKRDIEGQLGKSLFDNPIVQQCIERERAAYCDGKIVFYHAGPGRLRSCQYFIKELKQLEHLCSSMFLLFLIVSLKMERKKEQLLIM